MNWIAKPAILFLEFTFRNMICLHKKSRIVFSSAPHNTNVIVLSAVFYQMEIVSDGSIKKIAEIEFIFPSIVS